MHQHAKDTPELTVGDFLVGKAPLPIPKVKPKLEVKTRLARDLKVGDLIRNSRGAPYKIEQVGRHESAPRNVMLVCSGGRYASLGQDWPVEVMIHEAPE